MVINGATQTTATRWIRGRQQALQDPQPAALEALKALQAQPVLQEVVAVL